MVGMNLYNSRNDYNTIDSQEILISENNSVESNIVKLNNIFFIIAPLEF